MIDTPYPYVGAIWGSVETPDSGFILMHTSLNIFEDTNKINIVKVNKNGQILWTKSYGASGTAHDQLSIIRTNDSSYIFCGDQWKSDTTSAFLFKINGDGDSIWMKTYNPSQYFCFFETLIETSDGGFLATGGCDKDKPGGSNPFRQTYTIKTDSNGNLEWQLMQGSSATHENSFGIVETPNHEYLQAGNVRNPYPYDFYVYSQLVKIKNNGQIAWVKNYSDPEYYQGFFDINQTLDGNYLITGGYANDEDVFPSDPYGGGGTLTKINENGNVLWFKRYGDEINDAECYDFVELPDSSIATIGFSHQPDENSTMVKFSSAGEIKWTQTYKYNTAWEVSEGLFEIIHTKDNGFFMCGYGVSPVLIDPLSLGKGWILKVDSLGCPMPMCVTSATEPTQEKNQAIIIYPNPFRNEFQIELPTEKKYNKINIYDVARRLVFSLGLTINEYQITIDGSKMDNGVYFIEFVSDDQRISKKIIKIE